MEFVPQSTTANLCGFASSFALSEFTIPGPDILFCSNLADSPPLLLSRQYAVRQFAVDLVERLRKTPLRLAIRLRLCAKIRQRLNTAPQATQRAFLLVL